MTIDLSTLSPNARAEYIRIGRQYGSTDTLAQANQTLTGLGKYAPELVRHGFSLGDGTRLQGARDALTEAGVGRADKVGTRKVTSHAYVDALAHGKAKREDARSILDNARRALSESVDATATAGVNVIKTALQQTRTAGADGDKLATQLETLRTTLGDPSVAAEVAGRGGPEAALDLGIAADALHAASQERAGAPGTPAETELLDLLDGIIVGLVRGARKAARPAAKRLGTPALMADFELTKLYASRGGGKATPAPAEAPGAAPPVVAAPAATTPAGTTPSGE
jgi:hypothetical protein